jgi:hypothetical protein
MHTIVFVAAIQDRPMGLPVFPELADRLLGVNYRNKIGNYFPWSLIGVELWEN